MILSILFLIYMSLLGDFKELFTDQELEKHYHPENFEDEYVPDAELAYSDEQLADALLSDNPLVESEPL